MNQNIFQIEIDVDYVKSLFPSLISLDDDSIRWLWEHQFAEHGIPSGPLAFREHFTDAIAKQKNLQCLEIGPFDCPLLKGSHVKYFDVLDSEQLLVRANEHQRATLDVPYIDYVEPSGSLGLVNDTFDFVFSSHCIEHQPNLINHLNEVKSILNVNGVFALIVPDKRYCFDHYIPETNVAEIIDAHKTDLKTHSLRSIIEHRSLTTHNDPLRHWVGDHGNIGELSDPERIRVAIAEYENSCGDYIDVHAWQFTPNSFVSIMETLYNLGFSPFNNVTVSGTPFARQEFTVIMQSD
jgi:SAM-dependent methyltransferase